MKGLTHIRTSTSLNEMKKGEKKKKLMGFKKKKKKKKKVLLWSWFNFD